MDRTIQIDPAAQVRVRRVRAGDLARLLATDMLPGAWEVIALFDDWQDSPTTNSEWFRPWPDRLCVLDPRLTLVGWNAISSAVEESLRRPNLLTLLIPALDPPLATGQGGGRVHSLIAPNLLLGTARDSPVAQICFEVVKHLLSVGATAGVGLIARECPSPSDGLPEWDPTAPADLAASVIMAHRGLTDHLKTALAGLTLARPLPGPVRVGLDTDQPTNPAPEALDFPGVEFYSDRTSGRVGPYVIRQALLSSSPEPAAVFHDSDDLSTADRFHWLLNELVRTGCGMVGSHELRFDPDDREVRASRFPLDVNAALRIERKHPLLHPTSAIRTDVFHEIGGFSTDCVFGNDTQLLFRASFLTRIRNVPRFLYLRREHPNSLTSHPETGMSNPLRMARNQRWREDFAAVLEGRIPLEKSSLVAISGPAWRPTKHASNL